MRRYVLTVVAPLIAILFGGCGGTEKAEIPKNLEQPIPKAVGSGGGGVPVGPKTPKGPPGAKAD